jgi:hypothetical protein
VLDSRSIALSGVGYGAAAMARMGLWATHELLPAVPSAPTSGGPDVFDAPYQAYVKKITAERAKAWQRSLLEPEAIGGDDADPAEAAQQAREKLAPYATTHSIQAVAPKLDSVANGIHLAALSTEKLAAVALNLARSNDEIPEEAMFAFAEFMMADD